MNSTDNVNKILHGIFTRPYYPNSSFVRLPDIKHRAALNFVFPNLDIKHKPLKVGEYYRMYHITYELLCKDLEGWIEYYNNSIMESILKHKIKKYPTNE